MEKTVNRRMEEVKISLRGGKRSEEIKTEGRLKVKEQGEL